MTDTTNTTETTTLASRIRKARAAGVGTLYATLRDKVRGCRVVRFENLTGAINGNPHDVWVQTPSGGRAIARFDVRGGVELETWAARVWSIGDQTSESIIRWTCCGDVRGKCGVLHRTRAAAEACCARDHRSVVRGHPGGGSTYVYSDRRPVMVRVARRRKAGAR